MVVGLMLFVWLRARFGRLTYAQTWLSKQYLSDDWVMKHYLRNLR